MLQYKTIHADTLELLKRLTKEPIFTGLRLVGGTALALQYGHRNSIDLDFFGHIDVDDEDIIALLRKYGNLHVLKVSKNIKIFTINGIRIDIVNYTYKWIDEPIEEDGVRLASSRDIAAMKINAIEGRGTKKDFIDIFELLKHYTLNDLLDFHKEKYPEASNFRALMSLSYFEDADTQPMPVMFIPEDWKDMKVKIQQSISQYKLV